MHSEAWAHPRHISGGILIVEGWSFEENLVALDGRCGLCWGASTYYVTLGWGVQRKVLACYLIIGFSPKGRLGLSSYYVIEKDGFYHHLSPCNQSNQWSDPPLTEGEGQTPKCYTGGGGGGQKLRERCSLICGCSINSIPSRFCG